MLASQFVNPGAAEYLAKLRNDIATRPLPVLYRLFKWADEMWEIWATAVSPALATDWKIPEYRRREIARRHIAAVALH
jgi:hypothetical protein